jgi:hypothetical protein
VISFATLIYIDSDSTLQLKYCHLFTFKMTATQRKIAGNQILQNLRLAQELSGKY